MGTTLLPPLDDEHAEALARLPLAEAGWLRIRIDVRGGLIMRGLVGRDAADRIIRSPAGEAALARIASPPAAAPAPPAPSHHKPRNRRAKA